MNPWKKEDSYAPCLSCAHAEALQHLAAGAIKDLSFKLWLELSYILNIKHWDTEILSFKQMKEETTQDNYAKRKKKNKRQKLLGTKSWGIVCPSVSMKVMSFYMETEVCVLIKRLHLA